MGNSQQRSVVMRGQLARDCDCFLQSNFFIAKTGDMVKDVHLSFTEVPSEVEDMSAMLQDEGYSTDSAAVISKKVCTEYERRLQMDEEHSKRKERHIRRLGMDYFGLKENSFAESIDPDLLEALENNDSKKVRRLADEVSPGRIYSLRVFRPEFCAFLSRKLTEYKEKVGKDRSRPNSMNSQGVLIDEIPGATQSLSDPLVQYIVTPLARHLLALSDEWLALDNHRCFSVEYDQFKEPHLAMHFDNSEITLNIHLAGSFSGGAIEFCGDKRLSESISLTAANNKIGHAILHFGNEMHRALPIKPPPLNMSRIQDDDSYLLPTSRTNFIVWARSSSYRLKHGCPMCGTTKYLRPHVLIGNT